ncbi:DHA2 family efflux MFS transporter permease subunit, partial [Saccharomonospora saliphila]|uniref:DHA2 family efflux MFS transporter permease subunit n=1 Tax=Saccharomonospora saliphila TaxID=369829 RepID=UPI00036E254D
MTRDVQPLSERRDLPRVRSPWLPFTLLALIEFMTVLDASIVNVALPSIETEFGFSPQALAWVVDAYLLAYAGFLLLGGRAADVVGRRRMYFAGVVLFTASSLACGASQDATQLLVGRAFQGLGAALVAPAALALIGDIFAVEKDRNRALGIWGSMAGVGGAAGVVLGGLLTTADWRWTFLINVPIGIAVLVASVALLPKVDSTTTSRLDLFGALLGTGGLCVLLLAVTRGQEVGWLSGQSLASFAVAAVLLGAFVARQLTATDPLLPTHLFRRPSLALGNVVIALVGVLLFATFFVVTLYMQRVRGFSPLTTGLLYVPINASMWLGSWLAPRVVAALSPSGSLAAGLFLQAAGLAWWTSVLSVGGNFVVVFLLPAMLWSFGLGASIVSAFVVCTSAVDAEARGAASGLATTTYQSGGAIGLAVLVTIADSRTGEVLARPEGERPSDAAALVAGYSASLLAGAVVAAVGVVLALVARRLT